MSAKKSRVWRTLTIAIYINVGWIFKKIGYPDQISLVKILWISKIVISKMISLFSDLKIMRFGDILFGGRNFF
jgi:hypothetical protein